MRIATTVPDPRRLGTLPPKELSVFGLHLPWDRQDHADLGRVLLAKAVRSFPDDRPSTLQVFVNVAHHSNPSKRRAVLAACGMPVFQEKHGLYWTDHSTDQEEPAGRLNFRTIDQIGKAEYQAVMALCGEGTLDRNDRYYWEGCGPDNWALQMMDYYHPDDAPTWLVGYQGDSPVGYVAISKVEEWGSTIVHIGVVPEHRGNRHIYDLLLAGLSATRDAGVNRMLSDVDVLNLPMRTALTGVGMVEAPERWHPWVYRGDTESVARASDGEIPGT